MAGYTGEILLEIPRVDLFSPLMSLAEVMEKAIGFERGAFYFYGQAMEKFKGTPLYPVIDIALASFWDIIVLKRPWQ